MSLWARTMSMGYKERVKKRGTMLRPRRGGHLFEWDYPLLCQGCRPSHCCLPAAGKYSLGQGYGCRRLLPTIIALTRVLPPSAKVPGDCAEAGEAAASHRAKRGKAESIEEGRGEYGGKSVNLCGRRRDKPCSGPQVQIYFSSSDTCHKVQKL
jgi:hypothetical protein